MTPSTRRCAPLLAEMVEAGIRAKLATLEIDEREARAGTIFEYGHTVGHALELSFLSARCRMGLRSAGACCAVRTWRPGWA